MVIVGAGPVGMVLALDLAQRGVRSVLVNTGEYSRLYPKGNGHNTRTMEHYRRLGIANKIRSVGLRPDQPADVTYFTRIAEHRLARISLPSSRDAQAAAACAPATDQVPEPLHRGNQMYVERVLYDEIMRNEKVVARFGWRCREVVEHTDRVVAIVEDLASGRTESLESEYLVGCDGGRSLVRETIGAVLEGEGEFGTAFMQGPMLTAHVRIPEFKDLVDHMGWMHFVINPELRATFASLNGDDEFTFRTNRLTESTSDEGIVRLAQLGLGRRVDVEVLSRGEWTAAQALVADSYGTDRIFLCGDACHLFTPTGGFGMNTGIDDAANLAWKLAAVVEGWGGAQLLDSYQMERKPIGHRNTAAARSLTQSLASVPVPDELEEDSAAGELARERLGAIFSGFDQEFASLGVQLGARYDGSPIVVPDGSEPPPDDPAVYTPTGCPGGRAPHVWLADRTSIFDHFGRGFTLVGFAGADDSADLMTCARHRGVPLDVLAVSVPEARELYGADYALVRPDQHVAWRGDRLPADPIKVLAAVTGQ